MNYDIYQVDTKNPHWYRWKSLGKNNYFSPEWDVSIWIEDIDECIISSFLKEVIKNENLYENDKWQHYNVFSWQCDEVKEIQRRIKNSHNNFLSSIGITNNDDLWIRGWIFPQKYGKSLPLHNHAIHENSYLSGNIVLTNNNTSTDFLIPHLYPNIDYVMVKNKVGRMTLFPSYLPHKVDTLKDDCRYTLGFDIITQQGINSLKENSDNKDDSLFLSILL